MSRSDGCDRYAQSRRSAGFAPGSARGPRRSDSESSWKQRITSSWELAGADEGARRPAGAAAHDARRSRRNRDSRALGETPKSAAGARGYGHEDGALARVDACTASRARAPPRGADPSSKCARAARAAAGEELDAALSRTSGASDFAALGALPAHTLAAPMITMAFEAQIRGREMPARVPSRRVGVDAAQPRRRPRPEAIETPVRQRDREGVPDHDVGHDTARSTRTPTWRSPPGPARELAGEVVGDGRFDERTLCEASSPPLRGDGPFARGYAENRMALSWNLSAVGCGIPRFGEGPHLGGGGRPAMSPAGPRNTHPY